MHSKLIFLLLGTLDLMTISKVFFIIISVLSRWCQLETILCCSTGMPIPRLSGAFTEAPHSATPLSHDGLIAIFACPSTYPILKVSKEIVCTNH